MSLVRRTEPRRRPIVVVVGSPSPAGTNVTAPPYRPCQAQAGAPLRFATSGRGRIVGLREGASASRMPRYAGLGGAAKPGDG